MSFPSTITIFLKLTRKLKICSNAVILFKFQLYSNQKLFFNKIQSKSFRVLFTWPISSIIIFIKIIMIILILRFYFIVMLWLDYWVRLVICYHFSLWKRLLLGSNRNLRVFGKTQLALASWEMQTLFVFKFYWIISEFWLFSLFFLNFHLSFILLINNLIFMLTVISHTFPKNLFTKRRTFYWWLSNRLNKSFNRNIFRLKDKNRLRFFYVIIRLHFIFEFERSIFRSLL